MSSNIWVRSSDIQVTSSNSQLMSSNREDVTLKARGGRLKVQIKRLKAQVRRLKAQVEVIKPQVTYLRVTKDFKFCFFLSWFYCLGTWLWKISMRLLYYYHILAAGKLGSIDSSKTYLNGTTLTSLMWNNVTEIKLNIFGWVRLQNTESKKMKTYSIKLKYSSNYAGVFLQK